MDDMLNPVKALTQLDPIDGLRLLVSIQPKQTIRLSGTWNYANIGKSGFNMCGTWMKLNEEDAENEKKNIYSYPDFITAECASDKGIAIMGSYVPFPTWGGIMAKVEGRAKLHEKLDQTKFAIELREMFDTLHAGIILKHDALALSLLKRFSNSLSCAGQLEAYVWNKLNFTINRVSKVTAALLDQSSNTTSTVYRHITQQERRIV